MESASSMYAPLFHIFYLSQRFCWFAAPTISGEAAKTRSGMNLSYDPSNGFPSSFLSAVNAASYESRVGGLSVCPISVKAAIALWRVPPRNKTSASVPQQSQAAAGSAFALVNFDGSHSFLCFSMLCITRTICLATATFAVFA